MAEIQNTLGQKPKLKTYQSRPVQIQNPGESRKVNVHNVSQKMWNSISQSFESVFKIQNDARIAAVDLEKSKQISKMSDHYSANEANIMQNIKSLPDRDLDIAEYIEKYDNGKAGIKKYEFDDGLADQTVRELEAMNTQADTRSKDKIRQLLHQEGIVRAGAALDNLANRSVSKLRNDLIQLHEIHGETFPDKMLTMGKNAEANQLLKDYVVVLDTKIKGTTMNKEEKERRKYEYAQVLGNVLFEHYAKIDHEKALELAKNRDFIVGGISLDSGVVGKWMLNEMQRDQSEQNQALRNQLKLNLKDRAVHRPESLIKKYSSPDGKTIYKSSDAEFNKIGKLYGFRIKENYDNAIKESVLIAKGKQEEAKKERERDKKNQETRNKGFFQTHIRMMTKADNKDMRDTWLMANYDVLERQAGPQTGKFYFVNAEKAETYAKKFGLNLNDVKKILQDEVIGIPVNAPGEGMKDDFASFQSAVINYHTNKLFIVNEGIMSSNPRTDPKYKSWRMNSKEEGIYRNIVAGFEEIQNFNTDNFLLKSSTALIKGWDEIESNQTNDAGQTSVALEMVGNRYKSRILAKRIEDLVMRPNDTYIKELKFTQSDGSPITYPPGISAIQAKELNEHYLKTGQDRSQHIGDDGQPISYLPEWKIQGYIDLLSAESFNEKRKAEQMRDAYREAEE